MFRGGGEGAVHESMHALHATTRSLSWGFRERRIKLYIIYARAQLWFQLWRDDVSARSARDEMCSKEF